MTSCRLFIAFAGAQRPQWYPRALGMAGELAELLRSAPNPSFHQSSYAFLLVFCVGALWKILSAKFSIVHKNV